MTTLSAHALEEIKTLPGRFPELRSAVMPALDVAQEELGYLTPDAITEVAHALGLDPGYVEGVSTFYSLFHLEPVGRHRLYVCSNLSCKLRGADALIAYALEKIGVGELGQVSEGGEFSVEEVECLGACEYAPMLRLDHQYHYDLTPDKLDQLIEARSGSARSQPPSESLSEPRARQRRRAAADG